ncbi:MAG: nickel pincer cofactor biosynthesis protein LarC [Promethearchaeota archaeon]|nr:MAG: nickel pincer cofactor biosynthesis protein LarC [Candidatus Lokiarchaeota archaeon]
MKILFLDCINSGISGDMLLASLLELVNDPNEILELLISLKKHLDGISELEIELLKVNKAGIQVNQLMIKIQENKHHRTPKVLQSALENALEEGNYSSPAKVYAHKVLNSLFQAEAHVHGKLIEKIHLHELSSVDTLIDILGVTKALEIIGYFHDNFQIYCSRLPVGGGTVETAHGTLAVPAPATVKILENSEIIIQSGPVEGELVTPTGAALLVNLNPICIDFFERLKLKKVGYGTGQKIFQNFSNILRIFFGELEKEPFVTESEFKSYMEDVTILETNVDDVTGEILGNFIHKMENFNILDIQIIPSITKKNRPSYVIKILCHPVISNKVLETIFTELGTLGVRISKTKRACIDREVETVKIVINQETYEINYKISYYFKKDRKQIVNIKPEYEDLKKISSKTGFSVKDLLLMSASEVEKLYRKKNLN